MYAYADSIKKLIEEFEKLPGVGKRTAERFAFHVLNSEKEFAMKLAEAVAEVKNSILQCPVCFNLTDVTPCAVCTGKSRDSNQICVVEQPVDVVAIEKTNSFRGLYHVLMGALSPLKGVGPEDINIAGLIKRVEEGQIEEIILATDPDFEGDATAQYITGALKKFKVKISRIATGIPAGATLEFAGEATLRKALDGRREQS